jgi:3-hydroxy-9,10-secoandrosta-1,3,5(10)-triene-9,17-dione monooxygenase
MLGGIVIGPGEDDPPEYRIFLVPAEDYRAMDSWRAGGLEATGSNDVEVEQAFVPDARTIAVDDLKGGATPGASVNSAAVYRIPVFATFPYVLSGTVLGIAEEAIASFIGSARERLTNYAGVQLGDLQGVQVRIAEASASVDAAATIMRNNCAEAQRVAEAGRVPDILSKVRYRRDGAFAAKLCSQGVDLLYEAAGSSVVYRHNRLQQAFREIHAARSNLTFNIDFAGSAYGRVALGQMPDNPTL